MPVMGEVQIPVILIVIHDLQKPLVSNLFRRSALIYVKYILFLSHDVTNSPSSWWASISFTDIFILSLQKNK
jgi:hypothetical protein